jgi:predicted O-methyltransferase YrrM
MRDFGREVTLRDRAKRLSQVLFSTGDRLGVHVLPSHYYSSLPSWKWLRANEPKWRKPTQLLGIDWDLDAQARWMEAHAAAHIAELPLGPLFAEAESVGGFRYGPIEAQMLYGVIRSTMPRRIVEIGSGSSTLVMSRAAQLNHEQTGHKTDIVAIDPFTAGKVAALPFVTSRAEHGLVLNAADLALHPGDVLFIDSTHTVRTGSEVPHIYLELLPALPAGVLIHIHDIYLPYLFTPDLYQSYFDWQETAFVAALLVNNDRLGVCCCMSALHHDRPESLHKVFPEYKPARMADGLFRRGPARGHFPSSLWLETTG